MTKTVAAQSVTAVNDEACIAISTATENRLSFLHLPAEIRNKIYRYSLVDGLGGTRIRGLVQPPLTRINRQVRSEALPIYYGNNEFEIMIPPRPPMHKHDDWANFIRMFRVFKAGRTAGPGTGSLRFLRNVSCIHYFAGEDFWDLEAVLLTPAGSRSRKSLGCPGWGFHLALTPSRADSMTRQDYVHRCLENALGIDDVMHETCVQRLISTVVMVATECPSIVKEVHFHGNCRDEESNYWFRE